MVRDSLLQTRRGTAATWTSVNPTLEEGEAGFETDTNKFKIGDGYTAWNDLRYVSYDAGSLDENLITGNTLGSITLSNMFNTDQPMMRYEGITGNTITVPPGYDYAIYIDSQGNVTEETVHQGQTLTFKSQIVTGKSKARAGSQQTCSGSCVYKWKDGWWQWQSGNCKCTSNCMRPNSDYGCDCDGPDSYDDQDRPERMPIAGRPPWTGEDKAVYPKPTKKIGKEGDTRTTKCYCFVCLPPPRAAWSFKCNNIETQCGTGVGPASGQWTVETKCPDGWAPEVDRIQNPPNGQSCCQIYEEPCYNLESGNYTGPIGGNYPPV